VALRDEESSLEAVPHSDVLLGDNRTDSATHILEVEVCILWGYLPRVQKRMVARMIPGLACFYRVVVVKNEESQRNECC
jgi:hypothetical protein